MKPSMKNWLKNTKRLQKPYNNEVCSPPPTPSLLSVARGRCTLTTLRFVRVI